MPAADPERPAAVVVATGESVDGRPLVAVAVGEGAEVVLLIASIHGSEGAGTPLLEDLREHLIREPSLLVGRRVIFVDVANPDGLSRGERRNAHGVDLNRNFPARNFRGRRGHGEEPLSQPEARFLHALILQWMPARVVSLHQPLACVDWDGPGEELARSMARLADLPARQVGSRPGSLGSWVGLDLGRPIITFELPPRVESWDRSALWSSYGKALIQAVVFPLPM
jgi:protein MpaA